MKTHLGIGFRGQLFQQRVCLHFVCVLRWLGVFGFKGVGIINLVKQHLRQPGIECGLAFRLWILLIAFSQVDSENIEKNERCENLKSFPRKKDRESWSQGKCGCFPCQVIKTTPGQQERGLHGTLRLQDPHITGSSYKGCLLLLGSLLCFCEGDRDNVSQCSPAWPGTHLYRLASNEIRGVCQHVWNVLTHWEDYTERKELWGVLIALGPLWKYTPHPIQPLSHTETPQTLPNGAQLLLTLMEELGIQVLLVSQSRSLHQI